MTLTMNFGAFCCGGTGSTEVSSKGAKTTDLLVRKVRRIDLLVEQPVRKVRRLTSGKSETEFSP